MARDELLTLIRDGRLAVGTTLSHFPRVHSERVITAKVTEEGIRVGRRTYPTPSGAARAVTGRQVDGWLYWRLPSGDLLATLRGQPP
jgi:hypothetical protein